MLFSATYDQDVMDFAEKIVPDANILRLRREEESLDNIKQFYIKCESEEDKYKAIANIYAVVTVGQAMIFCQVIGYWHLSLYITFSFVNTHQEFCLMFRREGQLRGWLPS